MGEHYYTPSPKGEHDYRKITYDYLGRKLTFLTDANVFSRERVDFGSHLLIQAMEIRSTDTVLDVGCGYGPIGICAALAAKDGEVTMVDINERAVMLTQKNIAQNQIHNAQAFVSDIYEGIPEDRKFDCILTNPPIRAGKEVVYRIFEGAYTHLNPGGSLWVVIQKKQGADSAEKKLNEIFEDVALICKEKGYRIFKAKKLNT